MFPKFLNFFRNLTPPFREKEIVHVHAVIFRRARFGIFDLPPFMELQSCDDVETHTDGRPTRGRPSIPPSTENCGQFAQLLQQARHQSSINMCADSDFVRTRADIVPCEQCGSPVPLRARVLSELCAPRRVGVRPYKRGSSGTMCLSKSTWTRPSGGLAIIRSCKKSGAAEWASSIERAK